jgi:hypothetical protein
MMSGISTAIKTIQRYVPLSAILVLGWVWTPISWDRLKNGVSIIDPKSLDRNSRALEKKKAKRIIYSSAQKYKLPAGHYAEPISSAAFSEAVAMSKHGDTKIPAS